MPLMMLPAQSCVPPDCAVAVCGYTANVAKRIKISFSNLNHAFQKCYIYLLKNIFMKSERADLKRRE